LRKLQKPPYNNLGLPWHRFYEADVTPLTPGKPAELVFEIFAYINGFQGRPSPTAGDSFADTRSTPGLDPAPKVTIYRDAHTNRMLRCQLLKGDKDRIGFINTIRKSNPAWIAGSPLEGTMIKVNTAHWKVGLLSLLFAVSTVAGAVLAQEQRGAGARFHR